MIIERDLFIEQLEQLQSAAFNLEEENDAAMFLPSLLYYIGDADPYLRDELIYTCFVSWIEEKDYFEDRELENLANTLAGPMFLGRGLEVGLGQSEGKGQGQVRSEGQVQVQGQGQGQGQSQVQRHKASLDPNHDVLVRSFSALILTSLLNKNKREPILSDETLRIIGSQLCLTMTLERDLRSYDETLGWVHTLAHYSDLCGAYLKQEGSTKETLPSILEAFQTQLDLGLTVWTGQEEERFISAVYEPLFGSGSLSLGSEEGAGETHEAHETFELAPTKRVEGVSTIEQWIQAIGRPGQHDNGILNMRVLINKKQMLRSLYFRGIKRGMDSSVLEKIQQAEAALCRFK